MKINIMENLFLNLWNNYIIGNVWIILETEYNVHLWQIGQAVKREK